MRYLCSLSILTLFASRVNIFLLGINRFSSFQRNPYRVNHRYSWLSSSKKMSDSTKKRSRSQNTAKVEGEDVTELTIEKPTKKKTSAETLAARESHIRDMLQLQPPLPADSSISIITWNVNGLKALVKSKQMVMDQLIDNHKPDILCLQVRDNIHRLIHFGKLTLFILLYF